MASLNNNEKIYTFYGSYPIFEELNGKTNEPWDYVLQKVPASRVYPGGGTQCIKFYAGKRLQL